MTVLERSPSLAIDLDIRPLAGRIGAEIGNVRLAGDLAEPVIVAIEAALAKYKVIFCRNQNHFDDAEQERFAARLGDIVAHPTSPGRAGTAILELDSTDGRGRADRWHTDDFLDAYPKMSILRGVVIPPYGGDTLWASTVAAYNGLPAPLKTLAENLWAVHSNLYDYAAVKPEASRQPPSITRSSSSRRFTRPSIRLFACCETASARLCSVISSAGLSVFRSRTRITCSRFSSPTSRGGKIRCARTGMRAMWRSGTIPRPSTAPSTTTVRRSGWSAARP